jgi:plastocyanin
MTCQRLGLLALLVVGLAAAGCGGNDEDTAAPATTQETSATSGGTTLTGSVGPGFEISLEGTDGLTAGDYTLVVDDKATIHNFHLTGPGVDVATDVGGEGQETFQITLEPGEYQFVCDPHASSMNGSFTVG